jgi:hypothetical protein
MIPVNHPPCGSGKIVRNIAIRSHSQERMFLASDPMGYRYLHEQCCTPPSPNFRQNEKPAGRKKKGWRPKLPKLRMPNIPKPDLGIPSAATLGAAALWAARLAGGALSGGANVKREPCTGDGVAGRICKD